MIGSVGLSEMMWIILLILVLLVGSKKLPELARAMGRAMGEFQKGRIEVEKELREVTQSASTESADHERLERAAKELGIATEGKTDQELREEISKAVSAQRTTDK